MTFSPIFFAIYQMSCWGSLREKKKIFSLYNYDRKVDFNTRILENRKI